jgi:hypothetical protein
MPFIAIVLGWPAVIASIVITLYGFASGRWRLVMTGACLAVPFLAYLSLTPRFGFAAPLAGVSYFAAVWAIARGRWTVGLVLVAPYFAVAALVASLVLSQ